MSCMIDGWKVEEEEMYILLMMELQTGFSVLSEHTETSVQEKPTVLGTENQLSHILDGKCLC